MTAQITTVAELEALPIGSVVMTETHRGFGGGYEQRVWMRHGGQGSPLIHDWQSTDGGFQRVGEPEHARGMWAVNRNVTVLYRPDAPSLGADDQAGGPPKVASKSDALPSDPDAVGHYRKLPVTVEAIRYTPGTNCIAVAQFLGDNPDDLTCTEEADHEQTKYAIATIEGVMHASPGDYIIRGVHGEHYPCKGSIFEATYERADTPVIPGQNPTAEAVADALIKYETGGCCGFGTTCGLCDCGKADETPEQTQTRDAMELDRARAVLTQAQAEALRQAARDWSDWDGLSAPEEWLARRAAAIESGATHG